MTYMWCVSDTDPDDYTGVATSLTFSAGQTSSQTVSIQINDDVYVEVNETFNVQASSPDPRVMINGSPVGIVEATIIDNDSTFHCRGHNL